MKAQVASSCAEHQDRFECPDALIHKGKNGRFGLIIHDGGSSILTINYCPWCGANLRDPK